MNRKIHFCDDISQLKIDCISQLERKSGSFYDKAPIKYSQELFSLLFKNSLISPTLFNIAEGVTKYINYSENNLNFSILFYSNINVLVTHNFEFKELDYYDGFNGPLINLVNRNFCHKNKQQSFIKYMEELEEFTVELNNPIVNTDKLIGEFIDINMVLVKIYNKLINNNTNDLIPSFKEVISTFNLPQIYNDDIITKVLGDLNELIIIKDEELYSGKLNIMKININSYLSNIKKELNEIMLEMAPNSKSIRKNNLDISIYRIVYLLNLINAICFLIILFFSNKLNSNNIFNSLFFLFKGFNSKDFLPDKIWWNYKFELNSKNINDFSFIKLDKYNFLNRYMSNYRMIPSYLIDYNYLQYSPQAKTIRYFNAVVGNFTKEFSHIYKEPINNLSDIIRVLMEEQDINKEGKLKDFLDVLKYKMNKYEGDYNLLIKLLKHVALR